MRNIDVLSVVALAVVSVNLVAEQAPQAHSRHSYRNCVAIVAGGEFSPVIARDKENGQNARKFFADLIRDKGSTAIDGDEVSREVIQALPPGTS